MSKEIDLYEIEPGVYSEKAKHESVLSPGWFGRILFAIVFTVIVDVLHSATYGMVSSGYCQLTHFVLCDLWAATKSCQIEGQAR